MRITLISSDGHQIDYDPAPGGFGPRAHPCFQCGICCSRWQAPVDNNEIKILSERLGIPLGQFRSEYLQGYPMRQDSYLIKHREGACVFLRREAARSLCSVHDFRPQACRAWTPSLTRKECRDGLKRLGRSIVVLTPGELNLSPEQVDQLCQSLHDTGHYSIMRE